MSAPWWISGEYRWNTTFLVARMYLAGRLYSYDDLMLDFSAVKGERPFGNLYAQSLSMTAFLYDRLGEEAFWQLLYSLRDKDFPAALQETAGMTPHELKSLLRKAYLTFYLRPAVISRLLLRLGSARQLRLILKKMINYFFNTTAAGRKDSRVRGG